jgi:predicted TIM-barrel fold metal-dependent hydrolase
VQASFNQMKKLKRNSDDIFIFNHEIRPYLPDRIFDAHSHLCNTELHDYHPDTDNSENFFYDVGMDDLKSSWKVLFPDSETTGLVMGTPVYNCDLDAENKFVAQSVTNEKNRFSLMIRPQMSYKNLENAIKTYRPFGIKPYLVHALVKDKQMARITDFITEEQLDLANNYGLSITMHVSKPRGMADPDNLKDISRLVIQYPKIQFILAHCGRSFITPIMAAALDALPVAENLWVDTSAVCDTGVFLELFSRYDLSRILFGSDLVGPVAFRGKYIRLGMSWHVVTPQVVDRVGGLESRATFAIYENLSALFHAARFCQISEDDIQNIFYNNAAGLFKL